MGASKYIFSTAINGNQRQSTAINGNQRVRMVIVNRASTYIFSCGELY